MVRRNQSGLENKRAARRRPLVCTGVLEFGGKKLNCFVVDLSKTGAKVRLVKPLQYQVTSINLHIGDAGVFPAEIRWIKGTEIGLHLHQEIESVDDKANATIQEILRVT